MGEGDVDEVQVDGYADNYWIVKRLIQSTDYHRVKTKLTSSRIWRGQHTKKSRKNFSNGFSRATASFSAA